MNSEETDYFVYQFEAVSIQKYILTSSKLKEMAGASQLLEGLTSDVLDSVVKAQDFSERSGDVSSITEKEIFFARRIGGVFLAIFQYSEKAEIFAKVWPLIVQQFMPGLEFSCGSDQGNDIIQCIENIRKKLQIQKKLPTVSLPETTPISQHNPQTGLPAIKYKNKEYIDLSSDVKSNFSTNASYAGWLSEGNKDKKFPICFDHLNQGDCQDEDEKFPFSGNAGEHYVAVVHMDGNGIGQYIKDFMQEENNGNSESFVASYKKLSTLLEETSKQATQQATDWLVEKFNQDKKALPIRPLVLSGDDITFIIKADYAVEFVKKLTLAFEEISEQELKSLSSCSFPNYLTISTGMVFLRSNQPFYMAYQLAESLCDKAKETSRKNTVEESGKQIIPSTLSFHLISNSQFGDADRQIAQELTTPNGKKMSLLVYATGKTSGDIVRLECLMDLAGCFDSEDEEKLNISFMRKLATMLHQDPEHAKRMLDRYQEVNKLDNKEALSNFKDCLSCINGLTLDDLIDKKKPVPIADLIAVKAMGGINED